MQILNTQIHKSFMQNAYKYGIIISSEKHCERIWLCFMNLLFFLTPKVEVAYLEDDFTLRQALEKMEYHRYSSIPILDQKGEYVGTITEGDLLWFLKKNSNLNLQDAENTSIMSIPRKKDFKCVPVETSMEDLVSTAMTQNFVPVIDGKNSFIGLVKRNSIIRYCYEKTK